MKHPGLVLNGFLKSLNIDAEQFSAMCKCDLNYIKLVLSGSEYLNSYLINQIFVVFGIPDKYWIDIQSKYVVSLRDIKDTKPHAVCVLVSNSNGEFLSVSRKDNPNDVNLPAGKVDGHESVRDAAERELFEETGLRVKKLHRAYLGAFGNMVVQTYFGIGSYGRIKTKESGVVGWSKPEDLCRGTFKDYNISMFRSLKIIK